MQRSAPGSENNSPAQHNVLLKPYDVQQLIMVRNCKSTSPVGLNQFEI